MLTHKAELSSGNLHICCLSIVHWQLAKSKGTNQDLSQSQPLDAFYSSQPATFAKSIYGTAGKEEKIVT